MASLSTLVSAYLKNRKLQARLKNRIILDDGTVYPKGTVSDLLIDLGNGTYHFEANDSAVTVTSTEITIIQPK